MKFSSEFWEFSSFPTFIKAAATGKNRCAQDFRIYSTAESFLSDFGDDEQAINCANHFKENCNGRAENKY